MGMYRGEIRGDRKSGLGLINPEEIRDDNNRPERICVKDRIWRV
jgi:hypothetical protein